MTNCTSASIEDLGEAAVPEGNTVLDWTTDRVLEWANEQKLHWTVIDCVEKEEIDGRTLISMTENDIKDLRYKLNYLLKFGDIKKFWLALRCLQKNNVKCLTSLGLFDGSVATSSAAQQHASMLSGGGSGGGVAGTTTCHPQLYFGGNQYNISSSAATSSAVLSSLPIGTIITATDMLHDNDRVTPPLSVDGRATNIPPEFFKTFVSVGYSFLVTWITAFVMVVVHERVPDMKRYPPLPDIFLDNVPHIPWAFHMCEITGTLLFTIWTVVCLFHRHRMVLLRRFFGIAGTVFLLRCVTMLITSLSVPGTHLQCDRNDYKVDDTNLTLTEAFLSRVSRAYTIWSGLGMSIQGVRTCGDYMFSGHTVALTLLNFFITEYTPRNVYFLHTMTWLLNMFGIFFILAAHEHYSIDVFVAFYITSRLFLYYHTLANNQALMSHDSNRTRIWFPMFSYFESSIDGIVPNDYDDISTILSQLFSLLVCVKDLFMLTARRIWVPPNELTTPITNTLYNKFMLLDVINTKKTNDEDENLLINNMMPCKTSTDSISSSNTPSAFRSPRDSHTTICDSKKNGSPTSLTTAIQSIENELNDLINDADADDEPNASSAINERNSSEILKNQISSSIPLISPTTDHHRHHQDHNKQQQQRQHHLSEEQQLKPQYQYYKPHNQEQLHGNSNGQNDEHTLQSDASLRLRNNDESKHITQVKNISNSNNTTNSQLNFKTLDRNLENIEVTKKQK